MGQHSRPAAAWRIGYLGVVAPVVTVVAFGVAISAVVLAFIRT